MKNNRKVIVVSAHPDDETLGAGGTLLRHHAEGDELYWLIITNVFTEHGFSGQVVASRQDEINKVAAAYHFKKVFKLDYPTMQLSSRDLISMVPAISDIFKEVEPAILYTLNRSDAHSDHRVIFDAVLACTKSFRYPYIQQVLMYECISETEFAPALPEKAFIPNFFVDVSPYMDEKIAIMNIYDSEMGTHPFPRSVDNIKALAHFRGASVGVHYAEAFQLLKYIVK